MSIKVMSAVWELDLPGDEKLILLAFADHADDEGLCYPSIGRIAAKCCVSRSTIQRKIKSLVDRGVLAVSRGIGRTHTSRYTVRPQKGVKLRPFIPKRCQPDQEKVSQL